MRKLTIEHMQALAKKRGGVCLSTTYVNKRTKLLWRCSEGHEWETKRDTVQGGSWCPDCGGKKRLTFLNDVRQSCVIDAIVTIRCHGRNCITHKACVRIHNARVKPIPS